MFNSFNTHKDSSERAFEALCNQLFDRWLRVEYPNGIKYFSTVNGAGGDGGVEAYAILYTGEIVGVQAKWFVNSLNEKQIEQIKNSILEARKVRQDLKRYVVCLPRDFQSDKIGKGKKLVKNTEEKRINDLIDFIDQKHKDLVLEFWNEHRLREELQRPGNEGIKRFWFDREEFSLEHLINRFELAKVGWLKEKYTPSLSSQGMIFGKAQKVLFSNEFRSIKLIEAAKVLKLINDCINLINEFNQLYQNNDNLELSLQETKDFLEYIEDDFKNILESLRKGDDSYLPQEKKQIDHLSIFQLLHDSKLPNIFRGIKPRLESNLKRLIDPSLNEILESFINDTQPHNLILLGRPGTGKTHGLAKVTNDRLEKGFPALIIRAKGTPSSGWGTAIQASLGGFVGWTEAEIFTALEATAVRADVKRAVANSGDFEPTRVLISLDGIDESTEIENWRIRVNEASLLIKDYPRIRFAFSSRSYPPGNTNPCKLDLNTINMPCELPRDGDVPLSELVPKYLKEYKIKYEGAPWIWDAFENVLSLKLFCEEYQCQDLGKLTKPVTFSLANLLNSKIQRIDNEIFEQLSPPWSTSDQITRRTLLCVGELLQSNGSIEHGQLCTHISNEIQDQIDRNWAAKLLDVFTNHGILERFETESEDLISPKLVEYRSSFQSYLDYFVSIKATAEVVGSSTHELPKILESVDWNVIRLTAISLFTDHNILVGTHGIWSKSVESTDLQQLQLEAFSLSTDEKIKAYVPQLKSEFFHTQGSRNQIFEYFILPCINRTGLKLGFEFIHDLLVKFPNAFERDLVWSGPDYYSGGREQNVGEILSEYSLQMHHPFWGLPLVFAWSLTTTNNTYREYCRKELAKWAEQNIEEFIKILDLVFFSNDPQIQEDLSVVILAVASLKSNPYSGLESLSNWVSANVFDESKIPDIRNSIVRHCCRAVVERAFSLGEASEKQQFRASPPYKNNAQLLPLDIDEDLYSRERMPIVHDLAWYVIDNAYKDFLGELTESEEGEELLSQYSNVYGIQIDARTFAMSAAIAFIKSLGWNRPDGPGFTQATHGSLSKHGTFEEKYTWLAVREIQGYLADLVPFESDEDGRLLDYNRLVHVKNPSSDLIASNSTDSPFQSEEWLVPEDISPVLNYSLKTLQADLTSWVNRKVQPNFKQWISIENLPLNPIHKTNNKWVSLYLDSSFTEPNGIGSTSLEIICVLLPKTQFPGFLDYFKENEKKLKWLHFNDLENFEASPKNDTYSSLVDIVWMNWMEEEYSSIEFEDIPKPIKLTKSVTKVSDHSLEDGEKFYKAPSKFIRETSGINRFHNGWFFKANDEVVCFYSKIGEAYKDFQEMALMDQDSFDKLIFANDLKPFWIAHQFRTTSLEHRKERQEAHAQNSRFWLIWEDGGNWLNYPYHDGWFSNQDDNEND